MKRAVLDASLSSASAVHRRIARDLGLPSHFGNNLDSLWDCLRTDVPGPIEIVWQESAKARAQLGRAYERFEKLFRDLEAQRADFRFRAEG